LEAQQAGAQGVGALDLNMDPQDFDTSEEAAQGLDAQEAGAQGMDA
jgi:hypothetical protein